MLNSDFKEFAECLNAQGVEYLVVGGYALAVLEGNFPTTGTGAVTTPNRHETSFRLGTARLS